MHKEANLWLHLPSWNLQDSQLCLESKTEPSVTKAQNYMAGGGDIAQKKRTLGGRDIAHTLLMGKQLGWGHRTTLEGNIF